MSDVPQGQATLALAIITGLGLLTLTLQLGDWSLLSLLLAVGLVGVSARLARAEGEP